MDSIDLISKKTDESGQIRLCPQWWDSHAWTSGLQAGGRLNSHVVVLYLKSSLKTVSFLAVSQEENTPAYSHQ